MASRSLADLTPAVRHAALAMLERCEAAGVSLLVYCTLRSAAEQADLYAQGRTRPGQVVTWAKPGESLHQPGADGLARAFDAVPLRNGRPVWGTGGADGALWRTVGEIGEACGLEWAGRWPASKREFQHFQTKG